MTSSVELAIHNWIKLQIIYLFILYFIILTEYLMMFQANMTDLSFICLYLIRCAFIFVEFAMQSCKNSPVNFGTYI
jgi:hypothetical protein